MSLPAPLSEESLVLQVSCEKCGSTTRLRFSDWDTPSITDSARWTCPHCRREQRLPAIGRVRLEP